MCSRIAGSPDTVGLFYYAGHGVQTNGKNYLVPVDARLNAASDLEFIAMDLDLVLRVTVRFQAVLSLRPFRLGGAVRQPSAAHAVRALQAIAA